MKWTTVKETPPEHYKMYFVRHIHHEGGGYARWDGHRKVFCNSVLFGPEGGNPAHLQYLDESPTTADASVLKEALVRVQRELYSRSGITVDPEVNNMVDAIIDDALAQYNALPGSQGGEDWKSVEKDGYPDHNIGLLVCIPGEDYHITSGMWDVSKKWVLLDEYREPECPVTHYMLLPKLPKEFEKEVSENDAVMEHLSKLLKMGKIKKPDQSPSSIEESGLKEGEVDPQEIWDEFSELVDTDIDDLNRYAGREVMVKSSFKTMLSKYHITKK